MANEIVVLSGGREREYRLLFLCPIPAGQRLPARDDTGAATGASVVPTPSSGLPEDALLTAAERAALDDGSGLFHVLTLRQQDGQSDAQFLAAVQARYDALQPQLLAAYTATYAHMGKRFDAP